MTDHTAELNAFFAEPAPVHRLDRDTEYECASTLHLPAGEMDGNGSTIVRVKRQFGRARMQLHAKNAPGRVHHLHVIGNKPIGQKYQRATEGTHAFGIVGCSSYTVEDVTIDRCPGDAFWITSFGKRPQVICRDVVILRVVADEMGRHPISALAVEGLYVHESSFTNWYGHGPPIDIADKAGKFQSRNIHDAPSNVWDRKAA